MQQLAVRGLVRPIKRKGTVVTAATQWSLLDLEVLRWFGKTGNAPRIVGELREIRRMIEPFAARLSAERAGEGEIAEIQQALAALEAYVAGESADPMVDVRFHTAILQASGNRMIAGLVPVIAHVLQVSLPLTTVPVTDEVTSRALELHRSVVRTIKRREPAAAERAMIALIEYTYDNLAP